MSITTHYKVVCECGHEGNIRLRENDTPYSGGFWELYSLEGFEGGTYNTTQASDLKTIIAQLKPICPDCKTQITVENVKG